MTLGIDMGSATTRVALSGKGIVVREASVIADCGTLGRAVGAKALRVLGRTPEHVQAIQPIRRGVVSSPPATRDMLKQMLRTHLRWKLRKPLAAVATPSRATVLERMALQDACQAAGTGPVRLVPSTVAAAFGSDREVGLRHAVTLMDIGAGMTETAVVSDHILLQETLGVGSEDFDLAIAAYLRSQHNLEVGLDAAEELKREVASAHSSGDSRQGTVWGREMSSGLPLELSVSGAELREALEVPLSRIAGLGQALLDVSPPFLAGQILERGVLLTGGGSLLHGLDRFLQKRMGIPVRRAENPGDCAALGALAAVEAGWKEV